MHLSRPSAVRKIMRHESVLDASRPPNGERRVEPGHAAAMALYAGRAKVVIMSVLPAAAMHGIEIRRYPKPRYLSYLALPAGPVLQRPIETADPQVTGGEDGPSSPATTTPPLR